MVTDDGSGSEASFFLGFDGGGTKTECVLAGPDGGILARATAGPSNPLRAGYTRAWFSLSEAADLVLSTQRITSNDIRGVCAGIGGVSRASVVRRVAAFLERSFPQADVEVTTDLEIALEAAFGSGEGIVLVAGTGSAAFGRNASGRKARVGGRGPWFSDEGSGFDIGRRAAEAVLLAQENRGPATRLSERLFDDLEVRDWEALVDRVSKDPDAVFPKLFPLVAEIAESGDRVARAILSLAAGSLAALASSVAQNLGWRDRVSGLVDTDLREVPIALIGGMHGRSEFFDSAIEAELRKALPEWKNVRMAIRPAEAAARIASRAKGNAASIG
jgi:glucosamine kinase